MQHSDTVGIDYERIRPEWKGPGAVTAKAGASSATLFKPLQLRGVTAKNRIVVSPMCQYSSRDGFMHDWHLVHLGSFAKGGAGIVFTEATAVCPEGRITPDDAGLWNDEQAVPMKRIVDFIHAHKALAGIQVAHAGRKASTLSPFNTRPNKRVEIDEGGWVPFGPSPIAWNDKGYHVPKEMTLEDIQTTIQQFVDTTKRADKLGFDVLEIHGAHGYLISSFNSPLTNIRTDNYGGSFQNRTRFCVEITKAVRSVWPDHKPLFVRLSASDYVEGGWTVEDSVKLSEVLKTLGVDVIDCSGGGNHPSQKIPDGPGYQVPLSDRVKHGAGIKTQAVGKITDPHQAEEILQKDQADLIAIAREFLRNPNWPLFAAKSLGVEVDYALQNERAKF